LTIIQPNQLRWLKPPINNIISNEHIAMQKHCEMWKVRQHDISDTQDHTIKYLSDSEETETWNTALKNNDDKNDQQY
jgi:hypothetical protein